MSVLKGLDHQMDLGYCGKSRGPLRNLKTNRDSYLGHVIYISTCKKAQSIS
jgi:hypothetical protein